MKRGSQVKLIQPVLQGEIMKVEWDEDADCKRILVDLKDEKGNSRQRWVKENCLEEVV